MAKVIIQYEAETASLKAAVSEVNKVNDEVVKSAQDSSAKVAQAYKDTGKAAAAAFASNGVKKAIDDQNKSAGDLAAKLKVLYAEEVKLLDAGQKASKAYQDNQKQAEALRKQIESLNDETESLVKTTQAEEKATKSLSAQLRAYKNELAQLEQQGKENTKEFESIAIAAAKLEDQIGDTRERVKSLASDTFVFDAAIDSVNALAAGFAVVQGAVGLFAEDNQELQEAIAKTNSALAILNGLHQVQEFVTGKSAGKLALLTAGQAAYSAVVGTSTGLLKFFRLALAATGIGAAVAAVYLLVEAFDRLGFGSTKTAELLRNSAEALTEYKGRIEDARLELQVLNGTLSKSQAELIKFGQKAGKDAAAQLTPLVLRQRELKKEIADLGVQIQGGGFFGVAALKALENRQQELIAVNKRIDELNKATDEAIKLEAQQIVAQQKSDESSNKATKSTEKHTKAIKAQIMPLMELEQQTEQTTESIVKLSDAQDTSAETQLRTRINVLKTIELEEGSSLESRIDLIKKEGALRKVEATNSIADIAERNSAIKLIEAETQERIRQESKKTFDQQVQQVFELAKAFGSAFSAIADLQKQLSENRIENIQEQQQFELEAIDNSIKTERQKQREREALELRTNRKIAAEKIKQARLDKSIALFNAIVNTAEAVTKALPNPILAAAAAAAGAAQIALIAARPIPKFERGGVIGGRRHSAGGTIVEAERDEYIVNRNQSMKHRNELEAINTSTAAFRRLIDERYVRPAIQNFMLSNRGQSVRVNATLNSKSMEQELKAMRKSMKRPVVVNIATNDRRTSWR